MRTTRIEKNRPVLLIAAVSALILLSAVLIVGTYIINGERRSTKAALEANYARSFYNACDSVNNLEINLSKLMVAPGRMESATLIHGTGMHAELAEAALSELPLNQECTIKTGKYLNQVSDWCASYVKAIARGVDTDAYADQAETLYVAARNLNEGLKEISEEMKGKKLSECVGEKRLLTSDINLSFDEMQNNTVEYPELIYDGPFSDAKKKEYHNVVDLPAISEEEALKLATEKFKLTEAQVIGKSEFHTATYEIEGKADGREAHVTLTVKGGLIVGYDTYRDVNMVKLSREAAIDAAVSAVTELGYKNLQPVWYNAENGVAFVNLAPVTDGVTYYTDLVKAKIELSEGKLIGVEATGYCNGHHGTEYTPTISESTARSLVSNRLNITGVRLAVIPYAEDERLCYEVSGSMKGLDYFVYVDAYNGENLDIKRVIDDAQGEMIM